MDGVDNEGENGNSQIDEMIVVQEWLRLFEMDGYHKIFVENGWNSFDKIRQITNKAELKEKGINELSHRCVIMSEIRKLTSRDNVHVTTKGNTNTINQSGEIVSPQITKSKNCNE